MQILDLIRPMESDIKYEMITFPDGEPHIKLGNIDRKDEVRVKCRIKNPTDLFILMQVGDILNRQGVAFSITIYYLMSMRMDRVISFNEAFSLSIVAKVINSLNPEYVSVLEPHSKVTHKLITSIWGSPYVENYSRFGDYLYVLPDKGAWKRYSLPLERKVYCSKIRDLNTGKLSGFKVENPNVIKDNPSKSLLVVDDLCDGGGTFAGIAKELREIDPDRKLDIYVTHMVNPKGIITLSKNYDNVYFTNSYKNWEEENGLPANVNVIKVV